MGTGRPTADQKFAVSTHPGCSGRKQVQVAGHSLTSNFSASGSHRLDDRDLPLAIEDPLARRNLN